MKEALDAQDGLYTLVEKHPDGTYEPRVIGAITDYLFAPDDAEAVIEKMAAELHADRVADGDRGRLQPAPRDGGVRRRDAAVVADLEPARRQARRSVWSPRRCGGAGSAASRRSPSCRWTTWRATAIWQDARSRRSPGSRRRARRLDRGTASGFRTRWSTASRRRPPTRTERCCASVSASSDQWPVVCEPYTQWVLEDAVLGRSSALRGRRRAGRRRCRAVRADEAAAAERRPPGAVLLRLSGRLPARPRGGAATRCIAALPARLHARGGHARRRGRCPASISTSTSATLIERFSNPEVRDTVARLCAESSDRIPKWLLPVVRHNLEHDGEIERSAAVVASWARYAEGEDEQGEPIEVVDRSSERLTATARVSARTRTRSSRTASCSATSSTTSASSPPIATRWRRCTSTARAPTLERYQSV